MCLEASKWLFSFQIDRQNIYLDFEQDMLKVQIGLWADCGGNPNLERGHSDSGRKERQVCSGNQTLDLLATEAADLKTLTKSQCRETGEVHPCFLPPFLVPIQCFNHSLSFRSGKWQHFQSGARKCDQVKSFAQQRDH